MLLINRRDLLYASAFVPCGMNCEGMNKQLSLEDCANIICKQTPQALRKAVEETKCMLFRGENVQTASILRLKPDLLDKDTYNDPEALAYFSCMESFLDEKSVLARPSIGHIATSSIEDAIPWGNPVSIWPLGNRMSYVWAEDRKLLFPGSCDDNHETTLVFNERIEVALKERKEVLFSTDNSTTSESRVLAIPSTRTGPLMEILETKQYGL